MASRADRLRRIGELFLQFDPQAAATGIAERVFNLTITEDMLFPVPTSPDLAEEAARAKAENLRLQQLPTSVEVQEKLSFRRGQAPGEIEMVRYKHRADLGYKIPRLEVPGATEAERRQNIAESIASWIDQRRKRSPEEVQRDEARAAWNKTLYAQEETILILSPALLAQNQLQTTQVDMITGLATQETVDLNTLSMDEGVGDLVFRSEFNLLSQLGSKRHELSQDDPRAVAIQALLSEYLAR